MASSFGRLKVEVPHFSGSASLVTCRSRTPQETVCLLMLRTTRVTFSFCCLGGLVAGDCSCSTVTDPGH